MELKELAIKKLNDRGVTLNDIAKITYELQIPYINNVTLEDALNVLDEVLNKREVIHTILTAIAIDEIAEKKLIEKEVCDLICNDNKLYGVDEILALGITNLFGSIALTNFGYLDKVKPDIIGIVDKKGKDKEGCYTFLDDVICALVSSSCSRLAHKRIEDIK